jgi:peptidoglycan L-alanyl-D-glutamate endopeptidase CwlK
MYNLGHQSEENLVGVHPDLVRIVRLAIQFTTQDFQVHDGLRLLAEQEANIAKGVSWTKHSRHLAQADGYGHAVDLVPVINGDLTWDWHGCYKIAYAMQKAARANAIPLIWGGCWDRSLNIMGDPQIESGDYVTRRQALGLTAKIDGPHFELDHKAYP